MRPELQRLKLNSKDKTTDNEAVKPKPVPVQIDSSKKKSDLAKISSEIEAHLKGIKEIQKDVELALDVHVLLAKSEIIDLAIDLFEDQSVAITWLSTPKESLNNETPFGTITTNLGAEKVRQMLYRAEYGIFG